MSDNPVFDRIRDDIGSNDVVLYMKGTPVFPQCGFSAAVVQVLSHVGVKFKGIDILQDPSLRQGIKEFASWPTVPQLYVKGEYVGDREGGTFPVGQFNIISTKTEHLACDPANPVDRFVPQ